MATHCGNCGTVNGSGVNYCRECGDNLAKGGKDDIREVPSDRVKAFEDAKAALKRLTEAGGHLPK